MPDLPSYRRNATLLLVHPIFQHLLDFLSRGLVLVFFLFRIVDGGLGLAVLNGGCLLVVGRRRWRTGEGDGFGSVDAIGFVQGRYTSWVIYVRFHFERTPTRIHRRAFWGAATLVQIPVNANDSKKNLTTLIPVRALSLCEPLENFDPFLLRPFRPFDELRQS